jgi:hypothetical protein
MNGFHQESPIEVKAEMVIAAKLEMLYFDINFCKHSSSANTDTFFCHLGRSINNMITLFAYN